MARNLQTTTREAILAPHTDKVFLLMVEIDSDELAEPLRFVQNNEDITHLSNVYTAINFSATLPTQEDGTIQDTTITISGITRQIIEVVRSIETAPDMTLFIIRSDTPNTIEVGPLHFKLRQVTYDKMSVSGTLKSNIGVSRNMSTITVSTLNFPGAYD